MKTLKLLTSVFMSLLLTICVFSQVVIADSGCTFYIENQTISSGDTFEVAIKVKNNPGFNVLTLTLKYDEEKFDLIGEPENKIPEFSMTVAKNLLWTYSENFSQDGTICLLKFRAKDGVAEGNYKFELVLREVINKSAQSVSAVAESATITITCPHANKTTVVEVPATCAAEGTKAHEKCSDCGKLFLNGKEVTESEISTPKDPANHNGEIEIRNAVPATEKAEGYTGDTYCLGCNQKIKDGVKIPILDCEHSMTHTAPIAPDCITDGVLEHWTCSKCGKIYADEAGTKELESTVDPKLGHKTEVKGAKEAKCTEAGYTGDEICTVCNETIANGEAIPPKGHTIETVDAKDATCGEYGYTGDEVCTVCNETIKKGEPIPPTGEHEEEETKRDVKEADCSNEGYTGDTYCKNCGEKIANGEVIPKNDNHDYQLVVDEKPDFDKTGLGHEECTRCHDIGKENIVIDKLDCFHSAMEHHEKVAATCIAAGTAEYWHCTECNRNYSDEKGTLEITDLVLPIDPNNHVNTEIRNAKPATCSSEGYTGDKYCTDCNTLIESGSAIAVNPNAHNYVNNVCTYCGNSRIVYRPVTYMYIDDYSHLASGLKERHVPDSMTKHTDGEYEWNYCLYCQHEYGKVPIVNVSVDDTVDIVVDDPVQSGDDETIPDAPVTEPEVNEPVQDTNPPTGIAIALLPIAMAAAGAIAFNKTNR